MSQRKVQQSQSRRQRNLPQASSGSSSYAGGHASGVKKKSDPQVQVLIKLNTETPEEAQYDKVIFILSLSLCSLINIFLDIAS